MKYIKLFIYSLLRNHTITDMDVAVLEKFRDIHDQITNLDSFEASLHWLDNFANVSILVCNILYTRAG
jgi:hypothetical protein